MVETGSFQLAKNRVEAGARIACDLGSYNQDVLGKIRKLRESGKITNVDATGYGLQKIENIHFHPHSGESITEKLVLFTRFDAHGKKESLKVEGKTLFLNSDLYSAKPYAGLEEPIDQATSLVPMLNSNGEFEDLVALTEKIPS